MHGQVAYSREPNRQPRRMVDLRYTKQKSARVGEAS
jgi:hypothetical protein